MDGDCYRLRKLPPPRPDCAGQIEFELLHLMNVYVLSVHAPLHLMELLRKKVSDAED